MLRRKQGRGIERPAALFYSRLRSEGSDPAWTWRRCARRIWRRGGRFFDRQDAAETDVGEFAVDLEALAGGDEPGLGNAFHDHLQQSRAARCGAGRVVGDSAL